MFEILHIIIQEQIILLLDIFSFTRIRQKVYLLLRATHKAMKYTTFLLYWSQCFYYIMFMGFEKTGWPFTEPNIAMLEIYRSRDSHLGLSCSYKGTITDADFYLFEWALG